MHVRQLNGKWTHVITRMNDSRRDTVRNGISIKCWDKLKRQTTPGSQKAAPQFLECIHHSVSLSRREYPLAIIIIHKVANYGSPGLIGTRVYTSVTTEGKMWFCIADLVPIYCTVIIRRTNTV